MCQACYDVDTFNEKIKKYGKDVCDGSDMLLMTVEELKSQLTKDAISKKRNYFNIFKKSVIDLKENTNTLSFTPIHRNEPIFINFI